MYDDKDFQDEIRAHLEMAERERMADGADPKSARQAALKDFGNVTLTREAAHSVWTPRWLDAVRDQLKDIRYALRALLRNPAFSLTVIGVLTLGIGLNAAVFTMLKSFAFTPLSGVDGSARLGVVSGETAAGRDIDVAYPDYKYLREHDRAFSGLLASGLVSVNLGRGRGARVISGELVSGNYFEVLGVHAQRGRTLDPSDEIAPGRHPVVVLSDGLWRRDFGGDPAIVGQTIEINSYPLTVVGVADAAFHGTIVSYDIEVFIPVMMAAEIRLQNTPLSNLLTDRRATILNIFGHLRPGVSLATAREQTAALWARAPIDRSMTETPARLKVVPFWQAPGTAQTIILPLLMVLSAMGLLVLVIACANIAGLVVVRGASRRGEIAVRLALGATRARIVRLLVIENLVLAIPGAVLGVLLARRAIPVLTEWADALAAPQRLFFNIEVDGLVIGFSALIACTCALVFGVAPAFQSSRIDLVSVINEDATPRGAARGRLRAGLVVAQVAVSLMLLVGAGLVSRSLEAAQQTDRGYDATHVTAITVDLRATEYDVPRGRLFYRRLLEAVRGEPGVESATLAAVTPLTFIETRSQRVAIDGYAPKRDENLAFMTNTIAPDYFRTLSIGLQAGREFEDRDDETGEAVVVVNDTLAKRFWGDPAGAIGKRLRVGDGDWRTIIGVARDVKYAQINEAPRPYVYLPFLQAYRPTLLLHARGPAPVDRLVEQARARIAALDPDVPIPAARSLEDATRGALLFFHFMASMLFIFGVSGMALAALGTYGLVSYSVRQSTREIGIRMALGATRLLVVRAFLGRGLRLGGIGAAIGMVVALGAGRLLRSVLFGVSATDTFSFAQALLVVLGGVMLATLVPAWRAARTNPLRALRHQ
jgi:predicted permease